MPLYEYKCSECEHIFDRILKMDDRDIPNQEPCPDCKKEGTVDRHITTAPLLAYGPIDFRKKVPDGFKDVLRDIKKTYGHLSTIDV